MTDQTKNKPVHERFKEEFSYTRWSDNGPLLHIAHGTGLCSNAYTEFSQILAENFKAIGLDFRGHGRTLAPAEPESLYSWEIFYRDLEEFFRHFNQPVIAVGHSMGGTVSAVLAARFPGLVSLLILIEPGFMPPIWRPFVYFVQKTGLSMHVPFVTCVTKRNKSWKNKAEALNDLMSKGPFKSWRKSILEDYISQGTKTLEDSSIELLCDPLWEGKILATAPVRIWSEVPKIKCPTLVIYGENSKTFLPVVAAKLKKSLPQVALKKMPNTGHFIPMEKPEELAGIVMEFVEKQK
jgi:pimeloyl-ACP methyl ester carboxylesterase